MRPKTRELHRLLIWLSANSVPVADLPHQQLILSTSTNLIAHTQRSRLERKASFKKDHFGSREATRGRGASLERTFEVKRMRDFRLAMISGEVGVKESKKVKKKTSGQVGEV